MKNWKTTSAAVVAVLGALIAAIQLFVGDMDPAEAWAIISTALGALGIGVFARDADKPADPPTPLFR